MENTFSVIFGYKKHRLGRPSFAPGRPPGGRTSIFLKKIISKYRDGPHH